MSIELVNNASIMGKWGFQRGEEKEESESLERKKGGNDRVSWGLGF